MTSADVVYSLDPARDPETSGFTSAFSAIASIEAVDDTTVAITLTERVPTFVGMLANPAGGYIIS